MKLPTKEELIKERDENGLTADMPDFRFGGEIEGVLEFANSLSKFGLSEADNTFIEFLIWSPYPYDLESLIIQYENFVMREDTKAIYDRANDKMIYVDKYSPSQIRSMALAWFDRRIGKLVRIGALSCSMNTPFLGSIKENAKFENFIGMVKQRVLEGKL